MAKKKTLGKIAAGIATVGIIAAAFFAFNSFRGNDNNNNNNNNEPPITQTQEQKEKEQNLIEQALEKKAYENIIDILSSNLTSSPTGAFIDHINFKDDKLYVAYSFEIISYWNYNVWNYDLGTTPTNFREAEKLIKKVDFSKVNLHFGTLLNEDCLSSSEAIIQSKTTHKEMSEILGNDPIIKTGTISGLNRFDSVILTQSEDFSINCFSINGEIDSIHSEDLLKHYGNSLDAGREYLSEGKYEILEVQEVTFEYDYFQSYHRNYLQENELDFEGKHLSQIEMPELVSTQEDSMTK